MGLDPDETSQAVTWHVPEAHYLESWGDAVTMDGTATMQQPMIEPLYGGKTRPSWWLFSLDIRISGRTISFSNHWSLPEPKWRKSLHDGIVVDQVSKPVVPKFSAAYKALRPRRQTGIELVFVPSWST